MFGIYVRRQNELVVLVTETSPFPVMYQSPPVARLVAVIRRYGVKRFINFS